MRMPIELPSLVATSLITVLLLTVAGCASQQSEQRSNPSSTTIPLKQEAQQNAAADYPVRAFPTQTLYELLVAEFAGVRGEVPLAVDTYVKQAKITRDPNIVERAVRTASYAKDQDALEVLGPLWVEVDPDNVEARELSFFFLARAGEFDAALDHAVQLLEKGDGEPLISLPGFTENLDTEKRGLLLKRYEQLQDSYPADRNVLLGKMRLESQQGDIDQALKTAHKLLKLEPDNENTRLVIAQLMFTHKHHEQAITTLNKGIKLNPSSKKLQLQLIRFISQTDIEAARNKMVELVASHDDDFDLQFSLGLLNRQLGLNDEARKVFQKLISSNRRVADSHYQLAVMAEQDNRTDEALSHYALVNEGNSLLPAIVRISQLMTASGDATEARLYLHQLRLKRPQLAIPLYRIEAELLIDQQRYGSAYALLTESLEQHPGDFDLLYTRSLVSEKRKDVVSMEQDLRAIIDRDTNNASALNALGYSLTNHTDRYQEALLLIQKAHSISPDDAAIVDSLGWVLYHLGDNEEAVTHLREAFIKAPDPEVAAHLGEVLWVNGDKNEAINIWRSALETDPDSKYLLDTLNRFQVQL